MCSFQKIYILKIESRNKCFFTSSQNNTIRFIVNLSNIGKRDLRKMFGITEEFVCASIKNKYQELDVCNDIRYLIDINILLISKENKKCYFFLLYKVNSTINYSKYSEMLHQRCFNEFLFPKVIENSNQLKIPYYFLFKSYNENIVYLKQSLIKRVLDEKKNRKRNSLSYQDNFMFLYYFNSKYLQLSKNRIKKIIGYLDSSGTRKRNFKKKYSSALNTLKIYRKMFINTLLEFEHRIKYLNFRKYIILYIFCFIINSTNKNEKFQYKRNIGMEDLYKKSYFGNFIVKCKMSAESMKKQNEKLEGAYNTIHQSEPLTLREKFTWISRVCLGKERRKPPECIEKAEKREKRKSKSKNKENPDVKHENEDINTDDENIEDTDGENIQDTDDMDNEKYHDENH